MPVCCKNVKKSDGPYKLNERMQSTIVLCAEDTDLSFGVRESRSKGGMLCGVADCLHHQHTDQAHHQAYLHCFA